MSNTTKQPLAQVETVAQRIIEALAPFCERIEVAGSIRRRRPLVGDIEIVALPRRQRNLFGEPVNSPTELDVFLAEKGVAFLKNGDKYKSFGYGRHKVDLFLPASAAHWGCVFTIRTGSAEFSQWLVTEPCRKRGGMFRDGRLWVAGRLVDTPEEADVFTALGVPWVPPEERDDGRWLS